MCFTLQMGAHPDIQLRFNEICVRMNYFGQHVQLLIVTFFFGWKWPKSGTCFFHLSKSQLYILYECWTKSEQLVSLTNMREVNEIVEIVFQEFCVIIISTAKKRPHQHQHPHPHSSNTQSKNKRETENDVGCKMGHNFWFASIYKEDGKRERARKEPNAHTAKSEKRMRVTKWRRRIRSNRFYIYLYTLYVSRTFDTKIVGNQP